MDDYTKKRLSKLAITAIAAISLLVLINILFTRSIVKISLQNNTDKSATFTASTLVDNVYQPVIEKKVEPGSSNSFYRLLKKESHLLKLSNNKASSSLVVVPKGLVTSDVLLSIDGQKQIEKAANRTETCTTGSRKTTLVTYECDQFSELQVVSGNKDLFESKNIVLDQVSAYHTAYKDGLLSLVSFIELDEYDYRDVRLEKLVGNSIFYTNLKTGDISRVLLPDQVTLLTSGRILVDPVSEQILLVSNEDALYVLKDFSEESMIAVSKNDIIKSGSHKTNYFSLNDGRIAALNTPEAYRHLASEREEDPAGLFLYDLEAKTSQELGLPEDFSASDVWLYEDKLVFQSNFGLDEYLIDGDNSLQLVNSYDEGKNPLIYEDKFYFVSRSGLFVSELNSNKERRVGAKLVAGEDNLSPSDLERSSDGLYMSGFLVNDRFSRLHSWKVTDQPQDGKRLESILPYQPDDLIFVSGMEFIDNEINVELLLRSVVSNRQTGEFSYDETEKQEKIDRLYDRFSDDGFNPDDYIFNFRP